MSLLAAPIKTIVTIVIVTPDRNARILAEVLGRILRWRVRRRLPMRRPSSSATTAMMPPDRTNNSNTAIGKKSISDTGGYRFRRQIITPLATNPTAIGAKLATYGGKTPPMAKTFMKLARVK